nr:putative disease resistance protein RGA3 [Quercus suber]
MTHSFVHPLEVIGREHDKENIVKHLMNVVDGQNVLVIPIVGIGGLGKTVLAKLVFNDARVVEHFESIPDENWNDLDEEQLQKHLRNVLDGRKFLLVLDDVWNKDRNKWVELRNLLMGGANGSKILVTTRTPSVASMMGTMPSYNLKGLPHNDCMSIFVKWAFEDREERQHANLVEIGDEIVKKCKGVPLAVKSLGSLLYSKLDEKDWKIVKDNEMWKLERKEGDILSALQLSYNLMPSYLKECFAYCSLYPKDHKYLSMELIQLWMAHDLIQKSPIENQELEDIGNQYIEELYSRSFLEDYKDFGSLRVFKIHDLMHDLALSVQSGCLVINSQTKNISKEVRHLSVFDKTWQNENVLKCLQRQKSIRTIYCPIEGLGPFSESFVDTYISRYRYLRVLDLSDSCFEELPKSIGTMKHLRRLNLSRNRSITKLRNSICKLQNLQTLLLDECEKLEELPKNMRYMISLRLLEITTKQKSLPESLNSLQFLSIVRCGNMEYLSEVKQGFMGLRMLVIGDCEGLISLFPFLKCLTLLEVLCIDSCEKLDLTKVEDNQEEFKPSIRVLILSRLPLLVAVPQWFKLSTRTLQHMIIRGCPSLTELPEWLPNLASLKLLQIAGCPKLSSLPEGKLFLPTLRFFEIRECPELSRRCQPEIGEDWHKIAHVSTIKIDNEFIKQADN